MIGRSIAAAFEALDTRTIPGPWPGPSGESWELEIRPFGCATFQASLDAAGVKPRSVEERAEVLPPVNFMADLVQAELAKGGRGKKTKAAREEAKSRRRLEKAIEEERSGIVRIGYDARYPDAVLSLPEVAKMRDAVGSDLVVRVWQIDADGEREELSGIPGLFAEDGIVPNVLRLPADDEEEEERVEVLYLRGQAEGTALAAYVVREAAKDHLFQERRVPLGSGSRSGPPEGDTPG